ncbi:MAG: hypothetical protein A2W19_11750 [Spirochaetes bacterium RBG_16_49_21]|nr:MAG: hypothetical protein A2W19_11750 [Spirochaetes bacterium RBG_16_49_21]
MENMSTKQLRARCATLFDKIAGDDHQFRLGMNTLNLARARRAQNTDWEIRIIAERRDLAALQARYQENVEEYRKLRAVLDKHDNPDAVGFTGPIDEPAEVAHEQS